MKGTDKWGLEETTFSQYKRICATNVLLFFITLNVLAFEINEF